MADPRRRHPLREHARGVGYLVLAAGLVMLAGLGIIALFVLVMA